MWLNEHEVLDQLAGFGLQIDSGLRVNTEKVVRVRDADDRPGGTARTGWYWLHELVKANGDVLLVGTFGTWRDAGNTRKIELGKKHALSAAEREAAANRHKADKKRADKELQARRDRAALRADRMWLKASPTGAAPYLEAKGVQGYGVRYGARGQVVIPMTTVDGRIRGLEIIAADTDKAKKRWGRSKQYWPFGTTQTDHMHLIGKPDWVIMVAEGYATAASAHEATGLPVAVAFDAGNLGNVARLLHKRYPRAHLLLLADDDYLTEGNPGKTKAALAALEVSGSSVAPVFAQDRAGKKLTDWNDLHQREGLAAVRGQIQAAIAGNGWKDPAAADDQHAGGAGRDAGELDFGLAVLLERFSTIYPTETAFDHRLRQVVSLKGLRVAAGSEVVGWWLENARRRQVRDKDVVFDPERDPDDKTVCNFWGGWPTTPRAGTCTSLLALLAYLCGREGNADDVYRWILKWLAYPIQHPGAKMQTAVLIHGPEGTGKNLFFGCVREIYAKYGGIFSQTELESRYNGWASGKMFMIGNEVVSRMELYHQQGRLRNMITEREWQVEEKHLPVRAEANHCNFVFFSNRIDIAKLDKGDRRYTVVWTPEAAEAAFYQEVKAEVDAGGVAALHDYLLHLDLGDFTEHTKPPMTRSKEELIDLGLDGPDRFWQAWTHGDTPFPVVPCETNAFYRAYTWWSHRAGLKPAPRHVVLGKVGKLWPAEKLERVRYRASEADYHPRQGMLFVAQGVGEAHRPAFAQQPGEERLDWLSRGVQAFARALQAETDGVASHA